MLYWLAIPQIPENSQKNVSAPENCTATNIDSIRVFLPGNFLENSKKAIPQSRKEELDAIKNIKPKTTDL